MFYFAISDHIMRERKKATWTFMYRQRDRASIKTPFQAEQKAKKTHGNEFSEGI